MQKNIKHSLGRGACYKVPMMYNREFTSSTKALLHQKWNKNIQFIFYKSFGNHEVSDLNLGKGKSY